MYDDTSYNYKLIDFDLATKETEHGTVCDLLRGTAPYMMPLTDEEHSSITEVKNVQQAKNVLVGITYEQDVARQRPSPHIGRSFELWKISDYFCLGMTCIVLDRFQNKKKTYIPWTTVSSAAYMMKYDENTHDQCISEVTNNYTSVRTHKD